MRASSPSFNVVKSTPSSRYCPLLGRSSAPRMCSSVDLPEPDGPMMDTNSRCAMRKSTSRSATTGSAIWSYTLLTARSSMSARAPSRDACRTASALFNACRWLVNASPSLGYEPNHGMRSERRVGAVNDAFTRLKAADDLHVVAVDGAVAHVPPLGPAPVLRDDVHEARVAAGEKRPARQGGAIPAHAHLQLHRHVGEGQQRNRRLRFQSQRHRHRTAAAARGGLRRDERRDRRHRAAADAQERRRANLQAGGLVRRHRRFHPLPRNIRVAQELGARFYPLPFANRHLQDARSEEHTSELQSRENLVCRL